MPDRTPESYRCQIDAQEQCLKERDTDIKRLRAALEHCVNVLKEYERDDGGDLRGFLLGALDTARKALADE